ncbi:MAG: chemotaxis protein CheW [Alphaproteobacteria bacterium]
MHSSFRTKGFVEGDLRAAEPMPVRDSAAAVRSSRDARRDGFVSRADLEYWARNYASEATAEQEDVWEAAEWLIFRAGGELFTVTMDALDKVAVVRGGAMLPHQSPAVLGLMNLRGESVMLFDLARILGLNGTTRKTPAQRALLFRDDEGRRTGFLVECIETVANLDPDSFQDNVGGDEGRRGLIEAVGDMDGGSIGRINVPALLAGVAEWLNG